MNSHISVQIVGTSFKRKWDLQNHMNTHKDERLHKCLICSKSFKQTRYLKRHMKVHSSGDASVCDKALSRNDQLLTHMITHTDKVIPQSYVDASRDLEISSGHNSVLSASVSIRSGDEDESVQTSSCNQSRNLHFSDVPFIMKVKAEEDI